MSITRRNLSILSLQVLVLLIAALIFIRSPLPDDVLIVHQVKEVLKSEDGMTLPGNSQIIQLPDDWQKSAFRGERRIYHFDWYLEDESPRQRALLFRSINQNIHVYLNGEPLDSTGIDFYDDKGRLWFRPILYRLPTHILQIGKNHFEIHLNEPHQRGYMDAPAIGDLERLTEFASVDNLRRQTTLRALAIAMMVVSVLMIFIWYRRRKEPLYGLYGAGVLCWALSNFNFIVTIPPFEARYWDAFLYIMLGGFIFCTMLFMHRYLELARVKFEKIVSVAVLIGALLLLILPEHLFAPFSDLVWHPAIMLVGVYLYLIIYVTAWKRQNLELHVMAMTGSIMVLYGAHDTLVKLGYLPWQDGFFLPYSAAPSLIVFSALLIKRFTQTLGAFESLSADLHVRVQQATAEIENNLKRVQRLERQQLISNERERVARDIHDGVGGQLVTLLAGIKSGKTSEKRIGHGLQQAMEDLRLVIDSLDLPEGDLGTALASWRYRLERKIEHCGIQLTWVPSDVRRLTNFGPSDILQVLRLLDEAATNVVRHANASSITVEYGERDNAFYIRFTDNGKGGALESSTGHGLKNMQRRAASLKAELLIESSSIGTRIEIRLPFER